MKGRRAAKLLVLLLAPGPAFAANPPPPAATSSMPTTEQVKPAAERSISAGPMTKPGVKPAAGGGEVMTGTGKPGVRGPKIPEALRAQMKAELDRRIDRDVAQIKQLRGEAIGLLTTFVSETPKESHEMPEALLRLGELKWEVERDGFVERFRAWEAKPVDQRGPSPELNYGPSRELFSRVIKDYPWYGEYDLALYVDGFLATEQGKTDEALDRFTRIIKDFPNSRFIPDAHMAKAEAAFNNKFDYAGALPEYEEVLKHKESDLYGLALLKSAWCLWRLGNNDEAIRRFVSVIGVTETGAKGAPLSAQQQRQRDELQSEALRDVVQVFTEDERNTAQDLYDFLTRIGGDQYADKILKALAEQFYDQAHYERGIGAYELLLKIKPTDRDAGLWMLAIAQGYAALEDYAHLKTTYERTLAGYTPGGTWAKTQADPANVAATNAKIEKQLREHATQLHAKAQRDKTSRAEFEGSAALYDVYLSKYSGEPKAYEIQFYLGEIDFFRLDRNADAATHYLAAARGIPPQEAQNSRDLDTMRHDALYNSIAALERLRLEERDQKNRKPGQETESEKRFTEALDLFATLYPRDPILPDLFYREGRIYFDSGVYDPAVKIWGSLLERWPDSPRAKDAGESILESFKRAQNFDNIETWARRLKTVRGFESPSQQAKLDTLIVQAVFKQGEQKAAANDHAAAAAAYLRAAKEFPTNDRAAQACVNAELEAQKAADPQTLKEAAELAMGPNYRDRPESPQGAWIAATAFQAMGLFSQAADLDESMANLNDAKHPNYAKYEHTKDAAYNAVILREATGEHEKAVLDGQKFLSAYRATPEADEIVFQMGKAHQNAGRNKDAADLYRQYLRTSKNQDHRAQGYMLLAQAELKMGDEKSAEASLAAAVEIGKHHKSELGPDGKFAAARARYMEGERVLAQFEKIQIQGDVKQLASRLKQKTELLKQSATIFLDCVSMGVAEWSTAALYQIGHTYELFAKAMRESPPPPGLTEDQKADYQSQIETFAVPMEERSLDAYENGWKKAMELGIYNQWTAKMRDALGRLNAELYPPFKEIGFEVRSQGPSALPGLIDAPRRDAPAPQAAPKTAKK
jgi:TolA-binding protein